MKRINDTDFQLNNTCVTIGKFDGLHLGHQLLISELKRHEAKGLTSVLFTFDFAQIKEVKGMSETQLYSEEERDALLEKKGPQILISYPFTRETAAIEPIDFIKNILIGQLGARVIVMGDDFCFGKDRKGNAEFIKTHEEEFGYKTIVCPKLHIGDEIVSSTLIRRKLEAGDIAGAQRMLNREYF